MKKISNRGFTIVELLVVIVIIGILSSILFVSYMGVMKKISLEEVKADVSDASRLLSQFKSKYSIYPYTINCSQSDSSTNLCLEPKNKDISIS